MKYTILGSFFFISMIACDEKKVETTTSNSMIACILNLDCESNQSCINGSCITLECRLNSDCDEGLICQNQQCVFSRACSEAECPCTKNTDCLENEYCKADQGKCLPRECFSDQDCALQYICLERQCAIDIEADRDRDGVPDAIDLCATIADSMQEDNDLDMMGDACDEDDDNDGIPDSGDNCRLIKNPNQGNANLDTEVNEGTEIRGNACDLEVKGTDLIGKLNAVDIKLGSYLDSRIELVDSNLTAMIQEDGSFKFEQAIAEKPSISLKIDLKGYQSQIKTVFVNLKESSLDLGIIDLIPIKVQLKGKVMKALAASHEQIMVSTSIDQQKILQVITDESGDFQGISYQSNQKLLLNAQGYLSQSLDLSWNKSIGDFELIDGAQNITRLSETMIILDRDLSNALMGTIHSPIDGFAYDLIDFKLVELSTQREQSVSVNANGSFAVDALAQGLYRMEINAAGHVIVRESIQIQSGINQFGIIELTPQVEAEEAYLLVSKAMLNGRIDHSGIKITALLGQQELSSDLSAVDGSYELRLNRFDHRLNFYLVGYAPKNLEIHWNAMENQFTALDQRMIKNLNEITIFLAEDNDPNGDLDGDHIINAIDNCLEIINEEQIDTDMDELGDECDEDDDQDLIDDLTEILIGSNPKDNDSDHDGIDDFKERSIYDTDLNLVDSDGDGENDLLEIGNLNGLPLDFDGDRIIDAIESSLIDSDRDGANDEIDGPSDLGDLDGDGVANGIDCCVLIKNTHQSNLDNDELGDECDDDDDGDLVIDALDNCPRLSNFSQRDTDLDAIGDSCDEDDDNDGLVDLIDPYPLLVDFDQDGILDGDGQNAVDNCPDIANVDQRDNDNDDEGDACDDDDDNDDVLDDIDNCSYVSNTDQLNSEPTPDSFGNACDLDDDNDGILDENDNCPLVINVIQSDLDFDELGNACDDDDDGDGILDVNDNCPTIRNIDQLDSNGDGVGNACAQDIDGDGFADVADNCPNQFNVDQRNIDNDNLGDACDPDIDGDRFVNQLDNCVFVYNNPQFDLDGDGIGDLCDPDDDNDGTADAIDSCVRIVNLNQDTDGDNIDSACDNCPFASNRYQIDIDKDGLGDECDSDMDNDGFANAVDNCPKLSNANQSDVNGNGLGDACEIRFKWYVSDWFTVTDSARLNDKFFVAMDGGGIVQLNLNSDLNAEASRYHHTMTDGLASHDVKMISVDNAGNLWAVTPLGLSVRYSGNEIWETFKGNTIRCGVTDVNIDYSSEGGVIDLDVNPVNGDVYLAYVDRIIRKQGNLLSCFEKGTGMLNATIHSVDASPDGQAIWVGTEIGASRYIEGSGWKSYIDANLGFSTVKQVGFLQENDTWSAIVMNDTIDNPMSTMVDSNGNIVVAFKNINTPLPSFYYTESQLGARTLNISLFTPKSTIPKLDFNILRKSDDEILIASRTSTNLNELKKFNPNGTLENTAYTVNFNDTGVLNSVAFDDQGNYYLASSNGLYSSKDNFKYTTTSGLASDVINDVVIDRTGVVWIATDMGLNYFKNGLFSTLALGDRCMKLLVDDNNVLWIIKKGNLFYLENEQLILSANRPPLLNPITDMKLDENGEIWSNMGFNLLRKGNLNQFKEQNDGKLIGLQIDYLTNQRIISTYETNVVLNYANQSQRNINVGTSKLKPLAYRNENGIEAWVVGKGSLAKIIGWELSLENNQLDGNPILVDILPTMISMRNKNYALSKTEVTQEQYKFCFDLGICHSGSGIFSLATAKHPVFYVNWYDSRIYSQWLGGDLPTEEQWYYAATGGGQNIEYPWGNIAPTCQLANYTGCVGGTAPVCSTTGGNTAQGLCDMGGNVWEWNLDNFSPDDTFSPYRVIRGGGWYSFASYLYSTFRYDSQIYLRDSSIGFRVSRTFP